MRLLILILCSMGIGQVIAPVIGSPMQDAIHHVGPSPSVAVQLAGGSMTANQPAQYVVGSNNLQPNLQPTPAQPPLPPPASPPEPSISVPQSTSDTGRVELVALIAPTFVTPAPYAGPIIDSTTLSNPTNAQLDLSAHVTDDADASTENNDSSYINDDDFEDEGQESILGAQQSRSSSETDSSPRGIKLVGTQTTNRSTSLTITIKEISKTASVFNPSVILIPSEFTSPKIKKAAQKAKAKAKLNQDQDEIINPNPLVAIKETTKKIKIKQSVNQEKTIALNLKL